MCVGNELGFFCCCFFPKWPKSAFERQEALLSFFGEIFIVENLSGSSLKSFGQGGYLSETTNMFIEE